jgi:hypothetical protein
MLLEANSSDTLRPKSPADGPENMIFQLRTQRPLSNIGMAIPNKEIDGD